MERQAHVEQLAKDLDCTLVQSHDSEGMMYVEFGYIEVPFPHTQRDYLATLHELGHFALGHTQGRPPKQTERYYFDNGVLRSEAQAWDWALDHSLEPLEDDTRVFIWDVCLGSYYHESLRAKGHWYRMTNGGRDHVSFVWDEPCVQFLRVVKRVTKGVEHLLKTSLPSPV